MEAFVDLVGSRKRFGKNESPWVSVLNLCNSIIGAGVLSFPYGFRQTGILGGFFFVGVIWVIEVFALCLLVRVAEKYNSQSYQQMVKSVLGSNLAILTSVTMITFVLGSMISYMIITGDVFGPVFAQIFGENSILANRRVVILLFTIFVIFPLSMKTTLKSLKYSSVISVVMLTYLAVALGTLGTRSLIVNGLPSDVLIWEAGNKAFIIIDVAVMAFQCHIQVITIFSELSEHPDPFFGDGKYLLEERLLDEEVISQISKRQRSKRVRRMDAVIFLSMSICLVGFCLIGLFGYLLFPDVESDVLKSFGDENQFMNFARIGMAMVGIVCYPVQHFPARSIVDDAIKALMKAPEAAFSWTRHTLITLFFVGSTLTVALLITDLGTVFSIVGSTGGVMVVFIIPGLLLMRGIHTKPVGYTDYTLIGEDEIKWSTRTKSQKVVQIFGGALLIAFGLLIFVVTAYVNATGLLAKS
ncbi:hypothetical protein R1sor_011506 [Riccia sorocarpa]|uniref:Amino acid transporter transmembrane domain-containing protein n=1 Tax=Riccia sorocarpa TaxID=122646 RepID=A0ABD3I4Y3_9MARC